MSPPPLRVDPSPPRNRAHTRRRLIAAVGQVLAEKGFTGLGVNAVARTAGVDKVLIYRYFDGLPGLIAAFGREGDFWPGIEEMTGGDPEAFAERGNAEKLKVMARAFVAAIRSRPLTQEILAWEMVGRNELTGELEAIRETIMQRLFHTYFPDAGTGPDIPALSAVVGAAVSYLVTRSRHIDVYSGVSLDTEDGWQRLLAAIDAMIDGIMAAHA